VFLSFGISEQYGRLWRRDMVHKAVSVERKAVRAERRGLC
jgi:hypothetical protein